MKIAEFTSLARPLDLDYVTNKAIVLVSVIVFVVSSVFLIGAEKGFSECARSAFIAGLAVFFAWAIARELDPDYDLSAFVATGLSLVGLIVFGLPEIAVLLWILLVTRLVNRTSGLPATRLDSLVLFVLAGWLTFAESVLIGLMTALAFLLDGRLSHPQKRHVLFAGVQLLIVGSAFFMKDSIVRVGTVSPAVALAVAVLSSLFFIVIRGSTRIRAVGDQTAELLDPRRVQAAQILALLTALLLTVLIGLPDIKATMPLWTAIAGTALYRFFVRPKPFLRSLSPPAANKR